MLAFEDFGEAFVFGGLLGEKAGKTGSNGLEGDVGKDMVGAADKVGEESAEFSDVAARVGVEDVEGRLRAGSRALPEFGLRVLFAEEEVEVVRSVVGVAYVESIYWATS